MKINCELKVKFGVCYTEIMRLSAFVYNHSMGFRNFKHTSCFTTNEIIINGPMFQYSICLQQETYTTFCCNFFCWNGVS